MEKILASVGSMIVGGVIAAVTIVGLVNSQVNSPANTGADVSKPTIDYGTTR